MQSTQDASDEQAKAKHLLSLLSPDQRQTVDERRQHCDACSQNKKLGVVSVQCKACGCAGVSLIHGRCKLRKWPMGVGSAMRVRAPRTKRKPLLLTCGLSPGDIVTLTAAVRDLHRAYPGRFLTGVHTPAPEIWENNPYITDLSNDDPAVTTIPMHYPSIHRSNQEPTHFLRGYTEYLEGVLGLKIPTTEFRGDIYLTPEEESLDTPIVEGFDAREPYWVFIAGGKYDFTAKWWVPEYAQAVVDHFKGKTTLDSPSSGHTTGKVRFVQCGAKDHWHPELRGVENLIGKTSLRELIRLVYHARGVVCPVTFAMHLAAAVPSKTGMLRPCVVLSGGREPVHWVAYPGHECLNTIGQLPCCATFGCWRSRCQLVDDGDDKDRNNLCERPVQVTPDLRIAECMHMITPDRVIHAVERAEASLNRQDDALCRGIQAAAGASSSSESNQPLPVYRVSHDQSIWHTVRDEEKVTAQNARQSLDTVARLIRRLEGSAGYQAAASAGQGRGIVICAGGPKYLPCVWVCINMLRHHGCDLPVEVWHLGEKEMPWHIRESLMPLDTKCIDARMRSERYPARTLNGWEVKPYAILHSRFNEVLLLDADNVVARDPAYLFNDPRYLETGAVFWPDFNRFGPDQSIWQLTGIPYQDEPEFESGQILVNKSACWGELLLTMWFNEFSDFWYQHIHGDKDTFHLAWRRLNRMYAMPDRPIHAIEATMCQHDLQGMLLFMHRNFAKWQLPVESNRKIDGFQHEEACFEYLRLYEQIPQKSKAVVET